MESKTFAVAGTAAAGSSPPPAPCARMSLSACDSAAVATLRCSLRSIPPPRRPALDMVVEAVRRSVRSSVANAWGKKPIVKVLASVIEGKS